MAASVNFLANFVILAAGRGTRMCSKRPKVLHQLAGQSLLGHVLQSVQHISNTAPIVVVGHGADEVKQAFAQRAIQWVLQTEQLGTADAVSQALPQLQAELPTLVLYGDVPLVPAEVMAAMLASANQGKLALLTLQLENPSGYGRIVRDANHQVLAIVEEKDANSAEHAIKEVNSGILAFPPLRLAAWLSTIQPKNAAGEYYLTDVLALAVKDQVPIQTFSVSDTRLASGVNDQQQLSELERFYQNRQAQTLLKAGVQLADPARIDIRGELICDHDVFIDINCIFQGSVKLGEGVNIGAHCVIADCEIEAGSHIESFSHLTQAQIGKNCRIGPFARIRPRTVLAEAVHIGNFTEVKNSTLGKSSKANHLTYLGDSDVGSNVNIGAGTITCNYDGVNKYRTVIEDGAFIGSDTQLVAPVRVGANATLAAGTTLTQDAPAEQLTLSRVAQKSVRWKRPIKKIN